MNKKELIEKIESLPSLTSITSIRPYIDKKIILGLISQLDELQKVVVPQFVADWYEKRKNNIDFEIWHYLHTFDSQKEDEFKKWMNKLGKKQIQTLVNMHQFGYEVEKEPKYTVKIPVVNQYLVRVKDENFLGFLSSKLRTYFTRKELEDAGFGWVFDCDGIEVKEVEE